jgi:carbonic anhydrase
VSIVNVVVNNVRFNFEKEIKKMKNEEIAKIAFEIINKIRELNSEKDIEKWEELNEERKNQHITNVKHVIEHPNTTAEEEHNIWMKIKLKHGWKYGIETDRKNKIHNCLVAYEKLNKLQKLKDSVFIETVNQLKGDMRDGK